MMKRKTLLSKVMLLLCLLIAGVSSAWGDEITYTFSDKSWAASPANWTSGKAGNSLQSGRGVQVTNGTSGANATSPISLENVSQIVVTYSTNATAGAGSISFQVGSGTAKSQSVTKTGGTTDRTLTYNFSPYESGKVKITVTCTTNSIYVKSVSITYNPSVAITSITGMASSATIEVDGTTTLTPTVLPDNATETVVWESSDEKVATVSNGVVTGVATGTATITAKSPSNESIKAECEVTVTAATKVVTPTFSVAEGTYNEVQSVTLSCVTDDAVIRYTTDGTDPTSGSTVYSSAISVDRSMTIKAKAFKDGLTASDIASATYTLKCVAPTFSPDASSVVYGTQITISTTTAGATIYYTTNGDTPTTSSTAYDPSNKPAITAGQTIIAIAVKDGWTDSDASSAAYELKVPDAPTFSLPSGMVIKGSTLTLSSDEGTTIRYTTDGTSPSASVGTIFTDPIVIDEAKTVKAVAYDAGGNLSSEVSKAYTVLVGEIIAFVGGTDKGTTTGTGADEVSKSGVTISSTNAAFATDEYRLYSGSETTISVTDGMIKRIGFTGAASKNDITKLSANIGTLNTAANPNGTWTGNATSVRFSASDQYRAAMIRVYVAKTAAPTFSVAAGEYDEAQNITLSCATDDATIYYTTNGDTPTSSSTEYTGPISITETQTLKAIAIYDDVASAVVSATYTMNRPAAPTFDVDECIFGAAFDLHLTAVDGAAIYYTTNGDDPTTSSTVYDTKVAIPASTTTVKAIAVKNGLTSDVATATYTYDTRPAPTFTLSDDEMTILVMSDDQTITLTTNSDGDVTFTSSDEDGLLVDNSSDSKVGELYAFAAGDYTITVSTAATANYLAAESTVTVHVVKKITTMAISTDFSDGTDLKDASTGLIEGIVKYNDAALSPQPTITYTSSNTSVATVAADGEITFKKAGTTTITASYAGNDEYEECEAEYELTLVDTTPQETEIAITLNNTFFDCAAFTSYSKGDPTNYSAVKNNVTVTYDKGTGSGFYCNASGLRLYTGGILSFEAPLGYYITKIVLAGDDSFEDGLTNPEGSTTWTGASSTVNVTGESKSGSTRKNISGATVSLAPVIAISTAGLATYASDYALDYTNVEGIEAYIAKEEDGTVKLHQVKKVPAGTGVLLRSTNSGTEFVVPITTAATDDVTDNIFVRGAGATVASESAGKYNYILNIVGGVLGFYKANNNMVATNRAYLQTSVASARIALDFDDETTGIKSMDNGQWTMDNVYDMQGRKVDAPKKGLYIINGRKVVIK